MPLLRTGLLIVPMLSAVLYRKQLLTKMLQLKVKKRHVSDESQAVRQALKLLAVIVPASGIGSEYPTPQAMSKSYP